MYHNDPPQRTRPKKGLTYRIYLDLESVYDRVNIAKLLQKLAKNNISHKIIALVRSLFTDCSSTITVNGALSKAIQRQRDCSKGHCCHQLYSTGTSPTWQRPSIEGQNRDYQMP